MPRFKIGNMWNEPAKVRLVTTNSYVTQSTSRNRRGGELVMGRGAALELKTMRPDIPAMFGREIVRQRAEMGFYGLIILDTDPIYGAFQVKRSFKADAELSIIRKSTEMLRQYAEEHPEFDIVIPFPGIGFGHLAKERVEPLLINLPGNVIIYTLP